MKINKTNVEDLPLPESGQVLYWDDEVKGFGVRLTPKGVAYIVQGRINGNSRRVTLGRHGIITAHQAREKAKKVLAGFIDNIDPKVEKAKDEAQSVTLRTVAKNYISDKRDKLKPSSVHNINRHIRTSFEKWADKPVINITRDKVAARHIEMTEYGPAQADQAFRVLRFLLNYARARYRPDDAPILPENPVEVLNRNQRALWNNIQPREVRIPDAKIGVAWNLLQDLRKDPIQTTSSRTGADLICFLLLTGCRWSEGAQLTWDRVNLDKKWFHLPDTKNRSSVTLPLSSSAVEILEARDQTTKYVFPGRTRTYVKDARGTIAKLSDIAGVKLCAHDLRRTFTNIGLKRCRLELWKVKLLTNHKLTGDVTLEHYSDRGDCRFLAPDTERITAHIVEQGQIASADNVIAFDRNAAK